LGIQPKAKKAIDQGTSEFLKSKLE